MLLEQRETKPWHDMNHEILVGSQGILISWLIYNPYITGNIIRYIQQINANNKGFWWLLTCLKRKCKNNHRDFVDLMEGKCTRNHFPTPSMVRVFKNHLSSKKNQPNLEVYESIYFSSSSHVSVKTVFFLVLRSFTISKHSRPFSTTEAWLWEKE